MQRQLELKRAKHHDRLLTQATWLLLRFCACPRATLPFAEAHGAAVDRLFALLGFADAPLPELSVAILAQAFGSSPVPGSFRSWLLSHRRLARGVSSAPRNRLRRSGGEDRLSATSSRTRTTASAAATPTSSEAGPCKPQRRHRPPRKHNAAPTPPCEAHQQRQTPSRGQKVEPRFQEACHLLTSLRSRRARKPCVPGWRLAAVSLEAAARCRVFIAEAPALHRVFAYFTCVPSFAAQLVAARAQA